METPEKAGRVSSLGPAARWDGFGTSVFTEMTELARATSAVNLAQGFPDFPGPARLLDAVARQLGQCPNQYAPGAGEPRLREAVARLVASSTGIGYDPRTEVTITTGATEALFCAINGVVGPGDGVVVFEPFYDSYAQAVANAGGVLLPVRLAAPDRDGSWGIDWAGLERAAARGFRLLVLNSPHNPTGKVYRDEELDRIADALVAADAIALCDEVYEHLVYAPARHASLASRPALRERVIRVGSAAKTFGYTGFKVGWATAPEPLTRALRLVHQATVFSTNPHVQLGLADVLEDGAWFTSYLPGLRADYLRKRDLLAGALASAGFHPHVPDGTYFMMADYRALAPELSDEACARHLVRTRGVAAIPPSAFYARAPEAQRLLRFAFCKRDETLADAARRLRAG
jgi:aspartate/methionine/tyrosine aminotransferase